jgi:hypothetical protein
MELPSQTRRSPNLLLHPQGAGTFFLGVHG